METSSDRDYQDRRVGPTVSKEKWLNHAKSKLSKGYMLIVGNERRTANFYMREKGFEMCPYNVAKQMIKDGLLVEAGRHPLGTLYKLAGNVVVTPEPRKRVEKEEREEPAEEVETLLDDLAVEATEEEEEEEEDIDDLEDDDEDEDIDDEELER